MHPINFILNRVAERRNPAANCIALYLCRREAIEGIRFWMAVRLKRTLNPTLEENRW